MEQSQTNQFRFEDYLTESEINRLRSKPLSRCRFDMFFMGRVVDGTLRSDVCGLRSLYERQGVSFYCKTYDRHFWYRDLNDEEKRKAILHYLERLTDSRLAICMKGTIRDNIRVEQAIYYNRTPVIIDDEYESSKEVNQMSVRCREDEIYNLGIVVSTHLRKLTGVTIGGQGE